MAPPPTGMPAQPPVTLNSVITHAQVAPPEPTRHCNHGHRISDTGASPDVDRKERFVAERVKQHLGQLGLDSSSSSSESDMNHGLPAATKRKLSCKLKSGRERTTEDFVRPEVPWPHHGVYKGPERTAAKYSTLTVPEFVFGYLGNVLKDPSPQSQSIQFKDLRELMQDAMSYPWANVRNYHALLLGQMEQDEVSWHDRATIQDLRTQYSRVHDTFADPTAPQSSSGKPCWAWQRGQCSKSHDHVTPKGTRLIHACALCHKNKGKIWHHTEVQCFSKAKAELPKND